MSNTEALHHSEPHTLPQQLYIRIKDFTLDNGSTIHEAVVAASFRGLLNSRRDNAIVICHPLSGSAAMEDWWSPILERSDPALDPSKYCLICCNSLGSPYGSASPLTYPSDLGKGRRPYGSTFPKTTIRDDVRIHKSVLDILGVRSIHCVFGEGMGGMLALEWAFFGQDYVRAMVLIATTAKHPSWKEEQQSTTSQDGEPQWDFADEDNIAHISGNATATMTASLKANYAVRCLAERVGRFVYEGASHVVGLPASKRKITPQRPSAPVVPCVADNHDEYLLSEQKYLRLAAEFNPSFDDNCFRHMIDKIESHDVTRARASNASSDDAALKEVLGRIQQPTLAIEVPKDRLCPLEDQVKLSENIPHVISATVDLGKGRDGCPIEAEQLDKMLHIFLDGIPIDD